MFQNFDPSSDRGFAAAHVPLVREAMGELALDGLLVPHDDSYFNEYLPDNAERLMWLSGFSGSAGFAILLKERGAVFSDGRYTLQLKEQVDTAFFELHNSGETSPADWLVDTTPQGAVIGYDPHHFSKKTLAPFLAAAERGGFELRPLDHNPIDQAWRDQPPAPCAPVVIHPEAFSGRSHETKRQLVAEAISSVNADAALLSFPPSLAWIFNIRGGDVHASPLALGRALVFANGGAILYIDHRKMSGQVRDHLGGAVTLADESQLIDDLEAMGRERKAIAIDPDHTPVIFTQSITAAGGRIIEAPDPCSLPRARKTMAELEGSRAAHRRDGAAVTRFLHWFAETAPSGGLTEIEAATKLERFRVETGALLDISFDTISGAGAHGALPHYRVNRDSDARITQGSLYLVDSGGQYRDGTTDITRTLAVGTPSEAMRRCYTLVLKGHIALATARFPAGTTGHQLDSLARLPLWEAGFDYDHGTGHGVGSYLGVHEGPQNISKRAIAQPLLAGMICSNEPGYYRSGEFGIRIENLVIVTEATPIEGGDRPMHGFETITLAPLERELIDVSLLSPQEIAWVDTYHQTVCDTLCPDLPEATARWLQTRTAALV
ncbi:metallopeptidase M24 family protein [Parvularcula bermudensis HTCC2503]|uniref:Metallopeptidase M24 family protein n=1 Tax=Parvularcula bermudensis (strain ATCC BAA-594 / HTCC2503 / KCTC 12087) TaxID=314260 RepID=E0THB7_PARBH|nr:aminopeptidase P family protein [Parvularcula bermudensis]ADM10207.1 metallopeptidase M24 family protein [Parvularcula bermudensis HTCC2503]